MLKENLNFKGLDRNEVINILNDIKISIPIKELPNFQQSTDRLKFVRKVISKNLLAF